MVRKRLVRRNRLWRVETRRRLKVYPEGRRECLSKEGVNTNQEGEEEGEEEGADSRHQSDEPHEETALERVTKSSKKTLKMRLKKVLKNEWRDIETLRKVSYRQNRDGFTGTDGK
jgi:hypothetical protein